MISVALALRAVTLKGPLHIAFPMLPCNHACIPCHVHVHAQSGCSSQPLMSHARPCTVTGQLRELEGGSTSKDEPQPADGPSLPFQAPPSQSTPPGIQPAEPSSAATSHNEASGLLTSLKVHPLSSEGYEYENTEPLIAPGRPTPVSHTTACDRLPCCPAAEGLLSMHNFCMPCSILAHFSFKVASCHPRSPPGFVL